MSGIPKSLAKYADRIDDISDERAQGDGYWVYLKAGWINTLSETHDIHEDTIRECAEQMRQFVVACDGDCCKA